jgi:hypothetical protein
VQTVAIVARRSSDLPHEIRSNGFVVSVLGLERLPLTGPVKELERTWVAVGWVRSPEIATVT